MYCTKGVPRRGQSRFCWTGHECASALCPEVSKRYGPSNSERKISVAGLILDVIGVLMIVVEWRLVLRDNAAMESFFSSLTPASKFQRLMFDNGVVCSMSRSGNVTERTGRKTYRTRDEARDRNCLNQPQPNPPPYNSPSYNPSPYNPPAIDVAPTDNSASMRIVREWAKLGEQIMKGQPLRQSIPLSAGTKMMETVAAPPPAPTNYVDPFAAGTFPPITQSTSGPVKPHGSVWDPSQQVGLSPPAKPPVAPQQPSPSSGPCGPYAVQTGVCSDPITGFGR